ncbi:MAG: zinc ribbon domain-containing protein [Candidatus Geothermincolia bacterium]
MFCENCGSPVADGSKFCENCGSSRNSAAPGPVAAAPVQQEKKEKKGGFFSSPGGIALIVILALAVAAGITLGVIFLVKMGANDTVDAETVKVWEEYESTLEDNSDNIPAITTDQAALAKAQEDLKKTQERVTALEKVLKETGGTQARRVSTRKQTSQRDVKADQLAAALAAYNQYVQKMNELFTTLVGANLLDGNIVTKLNQILAELQKLGASVTVISNRFLANNTKVTTVKIDPPVLKVAKTFQADIQKNVTAVQQAEQQRLAAEKAAADQAAAAAAAEAERQAREASQQPTLDASRCPAGDPYCPVCYPERQ